VDGEGVCVCRKKRVITVVQIFLHAFCTKLNLLFHIGMNILLRQCKISLDVMYYR
jgi:hypothetical protein